MGRAEALPIEVVRHRLASVAEAMGSALHRAARSANIKERGDLSCAVFDATGRLVAQAAHIPVHLGALEAAVGAALEHVDRWDDGDVIVLNDPYSGGSHLPDLTTVSGVFGPSARSGAHAREPDFFIATRAHHADIGGAAPGSLAMAEDLFGEGLVLPPVHLARGGVLCDDVARIIAANSRTPDERRGDLEAQIAGHTVGARRLAEVIAVTPDIEDACEALLAWSERLAEARLRRLPDGVYSAADQIDDDGAGGGPYRLAVTVTVSDGRLHADFTGTSDQAPRGINAPLAVTRSAVAYVAACLVGDAPINSGSLARISVHAPAGSLLAPRPPAPVAGGNVETSQRVVDVVLSALAHGAPELIPAASQGTMNNVLAGSADARPPWSYYETIGGGAGASASRPGASAIQVHMTNTRNTPVEALEIELPIRVERYAIRRGSGGRGLHPGGDGIVRAYRFLQPATVTLLGERRSSRPPGAAGGEPGEPGRNVLVAADEAAAPEPIGGSGRAERRRDLPAKITLRVRAGDRLEIHTPGGGGWGSGRGSRRDQPEDSDGTP